MALTIQTRRITIEATRRSIFIAGIRWGCYLRPSGRPLMEFGNDRSAAGCERWGFGMALTTDHGTQGVASQA
jgi:hypothetical protein